VLVERKSEADFAVSIADGRLLRQAAALASCRYRPLLLIEGPRASRMPAMHLYSLLGASVSLSVMWRVPGLRTEDAQESIRLLTMAAEQVRRSTRTIPRFGRKPKRLQSRRLHILQGLPGVGPALARRLLDRFGSVERTLTAADAALAEVKGIGPKTIEGIREVMR
jgi:DNA excision repair protein ERCC-4